MFPIRSLILSLLLVSSAHAATHVWTGASSDRFSDAANWTGGSPAGDPLAELKFGATTGSRVLVNDIAGLTIRSLSVTDVGYRISGNAITVTGEIHAASDGILASDVVLAGDVVVVGSSGPGAKPFAIEGAIRGNGRLIKRGPGALTIGGRAANTYSGETVVEDGTLQLAKGTNTIAVAGDLRIESGTVFSFFTEQIADSSRLTIGVNATLYHEGEETVGSVRASGGQIRYFSVFWTAFAARDGIIELPGGLSVNRLLLTGPLTVTLGSAGRFNALLVGDAPVTIRGVEGSAVELDSLLGSRVIVENAKNLSAKLRNANVVHRGGLFSGSAGSLRMESGRIVPGLVTIARELVMFPAASLVLSGGGGDGPFVTTGGPVALGGATLTIDNPLEIRSAGTVKTVIRNDSTAPVTGTFAGLPEGARVQSYAISYRGGDGNDVVLRALPPVPTIGIGSVTVDPKVTMRITVQSFGPVTGTIIVRHKGDVLATATLVSGQATVELNVSYGVYPLDIEYSGDAVTGSATRTFELTVPAPTPTLTAVEPNVITRGSGTATVVLRGTNFVPGGFVETEFQAYRYEYVSPTELRWHVPRPLMGQPARTEGIRVTQFPGGVKSNPLTISWEAGPSLSESRVTMNGTVLTAQVRPGATVALMISGTFSGGTITGQAAFTDSDRDGRVTWQLTRASISVIAAVIDVATGEHYVEGNVDVTVSALDPRIFRGPAADSNLRLTRGNDVVWVRPGAGAWMAEVSDGVLEDADRDQNGVVLTTAAAFEPLTGSRPPAGFRRGDVMMVLSRLNAYEAVLADEHFAPEAAGTLQISPSGLIQYEEDKETAVIVRPDGSSGRVTVRVTTVDDTAKGGVDFEPIDTVVALEDGEMWKDVALPLIDDAVYSGARQFRVRLSEPAGAAIGRSETLVRMLERELPPKITMDDVTIAEGDGARNATATLRLAQAARIRLEVTWNMGSVASGTIVFAAGETSRQIELPFTGNRVVDGDRTFVVSAGLKGFAANAVGTLRITDDDVARISIRDVTVSEGTREIVIRLHIEALATRTVSVAYTTRDGSATAGSDYTATSGVATSPFSTRELVFAIPLLDDAAAEPIESFEVVLSNPNGLVIGTGTALVTIVDNDTPRPAVSIRDAEIHELGQMEFALSLSAPSNERVTVIAATSTGTAGADDFSAVNGTVVFEPGQTAATLRVPTKSDAVTEGPESFTVTLSNPTNATLGRAAAMGTILDRTEDLAVVAVSDVEATEGNDGTRDVTIQLSLSRPDTLPVRASWTTRDGTATAVDYVAAQGEVVFNPGQSVRTITVTVRGDRQIESNEMFAIRVTSTTNARVSARDGIVTIVDDESGGRRRATGH